MSSRHMSETFAAASEHNCISLRITGVAAIKRHCLTPRAMVPSARCAHTQGGVLLISR